MRIVGFVLAVFLVALLRPGLVRGAGLRISAALGPFARRPWLAASLIALLPLLIRIAVLSRWPIPEAKILDEFSYLYAADTFASGRLANPTHPHWPFFETVYVLSQPVMASKYPPAQGLVLAAGQVLLGDPWYGVWLSCGAMAAAFYWMLLAWLPRVWALGAGLWFALYTALLTDWMNSYWGGAVAATAGAVLLGAFGRIRRRPPARLAAALGALYGLAWTVLVNARPYEGGVVLGLSLAALLWRQSPPRSVWVGAALTLAAGAGLTMFYNQRITGSPFKLPYMLHDEQYAYVPPFWMQPMKQKPAYRQPVIANAFLHDEIRYQELREWKGWLHKAKQWLRTIQFYGPWPVAVPGLFAALWLARTRRYGPLVAIAGIGFFCLNLTVFHFAHYAAPFAGLIVLFLVLGWRLLAVGVPHRHAAAVFVALAAYGSLSALQTFRVSLMPLANIYIGHFRYAMEQQLAGDLDEHVIFVTHPRVLKEIDPTWVYNKANLDEAKTVWAADFGDAENQKLLAYYPTRTAWRLDLDDRTLTLQPYRAKLGQQPLQFIGSGARFQEKKPDF